MKNKKTFLVTGGSGFIGSNITKMLLEEGHKVNIFDNNFRGKLSRIKKIKNKNLKFFKGDIRNYNQLKKSFKNVDSVIHLAYVNGTKFFYTQPTLVLDVAIKGLINVVDICVNKNIKEVYIASSSEVYQTPNKIPTDEEEMMKIPNVMNPRYSYGGGKILSELVGINYGKKYFKKLIIFRPHNVYSEDMGDDHVIPEFIKKFKQLRNRKFKIIGTGDEIRSFIHIDDFVNAFRLIMKKGRHLNIYNIGTNEKIKIKDLAIKLSKILKKKIKIIRTSKHVGS
ncbi:NAD-dependent epimerase/dehydratase family protein, partial [Candidatus Pelagibacter sp.]|nr:NAD-dependent epimerase/dehydratase family protein [Candidatus Pelagibacter sp.]